MAVQWGLSNPGGGFDYLETLQSLGLDAQRRQAMTERSYAFDQAKTMDANRVELANRVRAGDFAGARQEAALGGDFNFANALGSLRDDQLGQLQRELDTIGTLHPQLKGIPVEQRAAVAMPILKQAGFSDQELANVDWTDTGIDVAYQLSAAGKAALAQRMKLAEPRVVGSGGALVDGTGNVIFQQPKAPDWVFDSESGSWLMKPGTGSPGAVGPTVPQVPQGTDGGTFQRMIGAESGGRQFAVGGAPLTSPKGAVGIAQVMPGTAPEAARLAGLPWSADRYRSDPEYNRALGEAYYNKQVTEFGDERKAAAAYNAGPGRVREAVRKGGPNWERHLPDETKGYLSKVFGGQGGPGTPGVINVRPPKARDEYRLLTPQEAQGRGLDPNVRYQISGKGQITPVGGQGGGSGETRKTEATLRKEFDGLDAVKKFTTARANYNTLRTLALKKDATPQDDIAIVFNFMKTLDPTSVVREGEFATAQNAGGVDDATRNLYNRIVSGNRLNRQQRLSMAQTALQNYKSMREAYNTEAEKYRGYAKDYGVSPDRVARRYVVDAKPQAGNGRMAQFRVIR